MPQERSAGKPTTRWYSEQEKAAAVRMVRTLRAETGSEHGTVKRVADQLGYGVESVRLWVRQADIDDGHEPGVTSSEAARVRSRGARLEGLRCHSDAGSRAIGTRYRLEGAVHDARATPTDESAARAGPGGPWTCASSRCFIRPAPARDLPRGRLRAATPTSAERHRSALAPSTGCQVTPRTQVGSHLLRTVAPHDRTKEMRPQRQNTIHGLCIARELRIPPPTRSARR